MNQCGMPRGKRQDLTPGLGPAGMWTPGPAGPFRHFPSDDAATKLLWLALRNITADWGRAAKDWKEAMNQFAILYEERFIRAAA